MSEEPKRSIFASLALWAAVVSAVLMVTGPSAIHLGVLRPIQGFLLFGASLLSALVALGSGLSGLFRTRRSSGRRGRGRAWGGVAFGGVALGAMAVLFGAARGLPPINDITTDTADPPAFVAAKALGANPGHDMRYPASFAAAQKKAYPFIQPIHLDVPPAVAFSRVEGAIDTLGFHTESSALKSGRIEATDTSTVFQFVDDIVVRVRPSGAGSVVDIRSRSRDGKGDLGVNADRIQRLSALIKKPAADGAGSAD